MKTSDSSLLKSPQSILLMGPPGGGKTTFALQWPKLWVADCDQNLAGPMRYLTIAKKYNPFCYDVIALDENNKTINIVDQWERLKDKTEEAILNPNIETLFIDSLTHVDRVLYAHACYVQKVKELEFQQWNVFKNELYRFIMNVRSQGKTLLMSCHENIEYDKKGNVEKYTPTVSTNLKNYFGYMFTDIWRCTMRRVADSVEARVETHPTAVSDLKSSLLFGKGVIEASYETVKKAIDNLPK